MSHPKSSPPEPTQTTGHVANQPGTTRRIDRGRGHSYLLDGQKADGVTWASDAIRKKALEAWFAKVTREYAINHWDELVAMRLPTDRLNALAGAPYADRDAAANRGTEVHKLAQQLAAGQEVRAPEALVGHVDAYLQFVRDWQPEEILVEVPVFHRTLRYAGTLDLVAELADGWIWLLDWKTGGKGIYPETALQLAAYRHAEFYLDGSGREQPMPTVDFCGAVWLRADGYDLHPVVADERAFRTWQYARELARFLDDPPEQYVLDAVAPPAKEAA